MTIAHFLAILRARWLSAVVCIGLAVGAALVFALLQKPRYTATALVLIDINSPDPVSGNVLQGVASPSFMITQVDILQSMRVAQKVVQLPGLEADASVREQWKLAAPQVPFEDWAADSIKRGLDVRPSRGSNVINVSFSDADPQRAARVANAYVQSYLATTAEIRLAPAVQTSGLFDERAGQLRASMERAQAKLSAFQRDKGLLVSDDRVDSEDGRLTELVRQVVALEAAAAESTSRQGQATASPGSLQEVLTDPVVSRLSGELATQEARFDELASRLGPANPQLLELRRNIDTLRANLREATRRASGSVSLTNSVTQSRLAQVRSARDKQRARVLELKGLRDEATVLQRDVESAQRSYESVRQRVDQSGLEVKTSSSNISALEYATVPLRKSSVSAARMLAAGLAAGLILACVTVLVRERRDRRIRTSDDFSKLIDLPIMAVVPRFSVNSKRDSLDFGRHEQLSHSS